MASISSGGIVRINIGGAVVPIRGNVKVKPNRFMREEGANIDSSVYVTTKPTPPYVEVTLSDHCELRVVDIMSVQCQDITIELPEVGRTFVLINGVVTGDLELNPENGEITGLKFVGADIREIDDGCPC